MNKPERNLFGLSCILAPLLSALSTFFWTDSGEYGITSSTLLIFGSLFWIIVFIGIFQSLREKTPRYASWGLLIAVYGAVCGGLAFAFRGFFNDLYGLSHEASLLALEAYPFVANAIFWVGGPAFPLSLFVLGIVLARTKTVPMWVGILITLGGALFPVSRIPRIEIIANVIDLMLLIPLWYIGTKTFLNHPNKP